MKREIYVALSESNNLVEQIEQKNNEITDDIPFCVGGELKKTYLEAQNLANVRINKINKELQELSECLHRLEMQQL